MVVLKKDTVELVQVINQTMDGVKHLFEQRSHEVAVLLPQGQMFVIGDAIRLEQVVSNLIINACKYTEPGGHIDVTLAREGNSAVISISDNGVGISPVLLPYIFDLFVQEERSLDRKQGGLGLGLTLVRRLVELQGGTVDAKSRGLRMGSEFTVRLPLIPETELQLPEPTRVVITKAPVARRCVLIIDDNVDAATTTQVLLELRGHEVRIALDGPSGLKAAEEFKPEVILLDIGLPGMDGYEVARILKGNPKTGKLLLIALSGYGQAEDLRKSKEAGFDLHLLKPADTNQLHELISGQQISVHESKDSTK